MTQRKTRALAPVGVALLVLPVVAVSVASPCHSILCCRGCRGPTLLEALQGQSRLFLRKLLRRPVEGQETSLV